MNAHLRHVFFNQCSTPKIRDIKWTQNLPNVYLNQCSTPKIRDIKWTQNVLNVYFNQCSTTKTPDIKWMHICLRSTLISALPRKLVRLNGRKFAECRL